MREDYVFVVVVVVLVVERVEIRASRRYFINVCVYMVAFKRVRKLVKSYSRLTLDLIQYNKKI